MPEGEKKKRKSPTNLGPVTRREMTKVRDEVGDISKLLKQGYTTDAASRLDALYITLDRMDLRFRMHKDGEKRAKKD